ncbi:11579_t:CDS:2, partial [Racocetra persica]
YGSTYRNITTEESVLSIGPRGIEEFWMTGVEQLSGRFRGYGDNARILFLFVATAV